MRGIVFVLMGVVQGSSILVTDSICICFHSQCQGVEIETGLSRGRTGSAERSQATPDTNGNF